MLAVKASFTRFDQAPGEGNANTIGQGDKLIEFFFCGIAAQAAAQNSVEARIARVPRLKHLRHIKLSQFLCRTMTQLQHSACLGGLLFRIALGDRLAEQSSGLTNVLVQVGGYFQASCLPVRSLTAKLIHFPAGQLDREIIG